MALNHKEPDRVPLDMGSTIVTGIQAVIYRKLKEKLGITSGDIYIYDVIQQLALVEDDVRRALGIDTTSIIPEKLTKWRDGVMSDGNSCKYPAGFLPEKLPDGTKVTRDKKSYWGENQENAVTLQMPPEGFYYEIPYHPLANARTKEDIDSFRWFWELDEGTINTWESNLNKVLRNTEYAIVADTLWGGWGQNYEVLQNLRGWDNFLIDLATNQDFAKYMLEVRLEVVLQRWDLMLNILDNKPQVVAIGDDLGCQNGPQLSPELYKKMIKPVHKKFVSFIKKRTGAKVFLHTCGSVYELIPDLIEVGIDILNPVQVQAKEMDSTKLKEFGNDLVFWGGIDTQYVLPFGSVDEVKEEVKRRMDDFAPNGGYVFNTVHNIQQDIPLENIVAMFEAFDDYCK
ncbi:MAG: uroporphyrinogen decarboxylase family protein [Planctomycetota bacterium]|jgi:uroporphyrinogen decarboxylase